MAETSRQHEPSAAPEKGGLAFASGLSGHPDAEVAGRQAARSAATALTGRGVSKADLAIVFVSAHHAGSGERVAGAVRAELAPEHLILVSAESVLAGAAELERVPGVAVLAARLAGVELEVFDGSRVRAPEVSDAEGVRELARSIGLEAPGAAGTLLFLDPFSVPTIKLLPALNAARAAFAPSAPLIGGIASAGRAPGQNALIADASARRDGLVGVTFRGAVRIDTVVSQGCRPVGRNMVITKARKNLILELGGRPALEAVREMVSEAGERERALLSKGLFLGLVIDEYKERFGRGDYLIRNVIGADENHGAIAVADLVRVGQTVRLHTRDAATADEDLALLLDGQSIHGTPAGAVMITCNGRGTRLFDRPNHDAEAVARAFGPTPPGTDLAKGGQAIAPPQPTVPLAGLFAGGEIGPVGHASHLHGHTACLALFRGV